MLSGWGLYNYTQLDPEKCEFVSIAAVEELGNGERLFVEIDDQPLVVFNIAGQLFAIGDLCSHDNGPLGDGDLDGLEVICPRHGARFDVRTGKATALPAVVDIPAYPVRLLNGQIEVGIPL
jgi:3-phenylpropionate/trans-cinnamate dioxygenase ferredoxin subunit